MVVALKVSKLMGSADVGREDSIRNEQGRASESLRGLGLDPEGCWSVWRI